MPWYLPFASRYYCCGCAWSKQPDACEFLSICSDKVPTPVLRLLREICRYYGFRGNIWFCGDCTIRASDLFENDAKSVIKNSGSRKKVVLLPHNDAINSWQHCDADDADSCKNSSLCTRQLQKTCLDGVTLKCTVRNRINPPPFCLISKRKMLSVLIIDNFDMATTANITFVTKLFNTAGQ